MLCLLWPLSVQGQAQGDRPAVLWAAPPEPSPGDFLFVVPEGADQVLQRSLAERQLYQALYPDGRTAPLLAVGLVQKGEGARLLLRLPEVCPAAPPDGGVPDGGTPDGGACQKAPERPAPPLALLLGPTEPIATPQVLSGAAVSGVVRRRIGRQSLAARGQLVGNGASYAAVWKRRAEALQLAVFGEDGALRLFQSVPWRRTRKLSARPTAIFTLPDLSGPQHDGLLIVGDTGAADAGPIYLVVQFTGRTLRTYP